MKLPLLSPTTGTMVTCACHPLRRDAPRPAEPPRGLHAAPLAQEPRRNAQHAAAGAVAERRPRQHLLAAAARAAAGTGGEGAAAGRRQPGGVPCRRHVPAGAAGRLFVRHMLALTARLRPTHDLPQERLGPDNMSHAQCECLACNTRKNQVKIACFDGDPLNELLQEEGARSTDPYGGASRLGGSVAHLQRSSPPQAHDPPQRPSPGGRGPGPGAPPRPARPGDAAATPGARVAAHAA